MKTIEIVVWVCPRCGHYYGAHNAGDLQYKWNTDIKQQATHNRAQCPNCNIQREPHTFTVEIPGETDGDQVAQR